MMGTWQGCQGNGCAEEPRRARWFGVKRSEAIKTQPPVPAGAAASPGEVWSVPACVSKPPSVASFVAKLFSGALSREGRWMGVDYGQLSFPILSFLKLQLQKSFECT